MTQSAEEIASIQLARLCPLPLRLAWHENRASYFFCRKERSSVHLRLHRLFVKAPSPVLAAVVGYAMKATSELARLFGKWRTSISLKSESILNLLKQRDVSIIFSSFATESKNSTFHISMFQLDGLSVGVSANFGVSPSAAMIDIATKSGSTRFLTIP